MTGWRVRRATPSDAPALALVAAATFLETYADLIPVTDMVAHCGDKCSPALFADWATRPGYAVALAEVERTGAPIGFSALTPPDLPVATGPGDVELRRIYALSTFHGRGVGPALMVRALDDARAMGAGRVLLGVNGDNARAHAFYERQGFAVVGTRRFRVGAGEYDDRVYARPV